MVQRVALGAGGDELAHRCPDPDGGRLDLADQRSLVRYTLAEHGFGERMPEPSALVEGEQLVDLLVGQFRLKLPEREARVLDDVGEAANVAREHALDVVGHAAGDLDRPGDLGEVEALRSEQHRTSHWSP